MNDGLGRQNAAYHGLIQHRKDTVHLIERTQLYRTVYRMTCLAQGGKQLVEDFVEVGLDKFQTPRMKSVPHRSGADT
jgi:hypothetical protein